MTNEARPGRSSLEAILSARGVVMGGVPFPQYEFYSAPPLRDFFHTSGVAYDSPFGHFVRLVISEESIVRSLTRYLRGTSPLRINPQEVATQRNLLDKVRGVRKTIGSDIFGDEHEDYAQRAKGAVYAPSRQQREKGLEVRKAFVAEIETSFPQALETDS